MTAALAREQLMTEKSIELLLSDHTIPLRNNQEVFSRSYLSLLERLSSFTDQNDLSALTQELYSLGEAYRRIDMKYQVEAYWYTPTSLPPVNLALNTAYYFVYGYGEGDVYRFFLEKLRELLSSIRRGFDALSGRLLSAGEAEQDQRATVLQALDEMEEAMKGFDEIARTGSPDLFNHYAPDLQAAAEKYAAATGALSAIEETTGTVMCFQCGQPNPGGEVSCHHCRALLPQVEGTRKSHFNTLAEGGLQEEQLPVMTEHVKTLFEAADSLLAGSISPGDFEMNVADMEKRLKSAARAAKDVPPLTPEIEERLGKVKAAEVHNLLREAIASYREGIDAFSSGLSLFRQFGQTLSHENLEAAKGSILRGARSLQNSVAFIQKEYDLKGI